MHGFRSEAFTTRLLPDQADERAPDGTEIRRLARLGAASMAHGVLPPGTVSGAVTHRTVEEIWFVLSGQAELWRKQADREEVVLLEAGMSVTIPLGVHFQFRTAGKAPFVFIMCTVPPWTADDEAVHVAGHWNAHRA